MNLGFEIFLDAPASGENAKNIIEQQIKENPLMVYMKGNPMMPQCGFSARVVQIMNLMGVKYTTFNVLSDPFIREGVKEYGNWPTVPQVYHNGELLGGCDIISDLYQSGELDSILSAES